MKIKRNDGIEYDRKAKDKIYTKCMTMKFDPKQIDIAQERAKDMGFKSFNDFVRVAIDLMMNCQENQAKDKQKISKR